MPLYTYVLSYKGFTYTVQDQRSNFRGFTSSWTRDLPHDAFPWLDQKDLRELIEKSVRGDFVEVLHRKHVWRKHIELAGGDFVVYAIETSR